MKELLLLLAHYPYDKKDRDILSVLLSEINDWELFVKLVNDHGIIALAAHNIKEAQLEKMIPEKSMGILDNGLLQSIVRNAWLMDRWKEVNEILKNAGLKHILLKGMALEHTIYEARGLRQMGDTDILMKRDEALKAWSILQNCGFKPLMPKSAFHLKMITHYGKHLPTLVKNDYAVEIHTRLFDETIDDQELYGRIFSDSVEIEVREEKAYILPENIHLKYLNKHHTRHQEEGNCQIRTYTDIKMLDPDNHLEFPDNFLYEPDQSYKHNFLKASYRRAVASVPPKYRLRFLAGDIFPSVKWMKKRYGCCTIMAFLRYPQRLGKLLWLV
jgi:hypothetical protein